MPVFTILGPKLPGASARVAEVRAITTRLLSCHRTNAHRMPRGRRRLESLFALMRGARRDETLTQLKTAQRMAF